MPDRLTPYSLIGLLLATLVLSVYVVARPPPFMEGVFWKVTKDGEVVGHILGTIHSNDERVTRIADTVLQTFDDSNGYAIEAFPGSDLWNPYHGFQSIRGRMMLPRGTSLADVAGEDVAGQVYEILKRNQVDDDFARNIKPWAAIHSVSIRSEHIGPIIDQKLLDLAVIQDKDLYQIESAEELLASFYGMPMDSQVSLLKDKLRAYPGLRDTMESIIQAYQREDLQEMMDLSIGFIDKDREKKEHLEAYLKHAINDRSIVMAHYMQEPFRDRNAFVAVGALHLYGKDGVLSLIGQDLFGGFDVERVEIK